MSDRKYAANIEMVLENRDGKTVPVNRNFNGLVKISPIIQLDSEKLSAFFIIGLGGGYVEGEKYKFGFTLKKGARAVITTQASTKVYKCLHGKETEQYTNILLEKDSILEYVTDSVILYRDAKYRQENNIYMDEDATLIYTDGITSGWSPTGEDFTYNFTQLKTNLYVNGEIVLVDNLVVTPKENDVTKIGFFEGYLNFGTMIVINKNITPSVIEELRVRINELNLPIDFGISELEVNGFVLRVLGNLTQNIERAIRVCHNYIRKEFLGSKDLVIRKY